MTVKIQLTWEADSRINSMLLSTQKHSESAVVRQIFHTKKFPLNWQQNLQSRLTCDFNVLIHGVSSLCYLFSRHLIFLFSFLLAFFLFYYLHFSDLILFFGHSKLLIVAFCVLCFGRIIGLETMKAGIH